MGEAEVQALLTQGMIRTNDLAFEVSPETGKALSDWKMLWQFPEFDRRAKAAAAAVAAGKPVPTHPDRREPPSEKKIEELVKRALPEDLLNITPEDLIPRQGMGGPGSKLPKLDESDLAELAGQDTGESHAAMRWIGMGLAAIVAVAIVSQWLSSSSSTSSSAPVSQVEETQRAPSSPQSAPPASNYSRSLPGGDRPKLQVSKPEITTPTARRDEEPVRRDNGNLTSDPRDREDEEMAEEDDAVAEDFAFDSSRKNAKKKKKQLVTSEEDEEEGLDPREPAAEAEELE